MSKSKKDNCYIDNSENNNNGEFILEKAEYKLSGGQSEEKRTVLSDLNFIENSLDNLNLQEANPNIPKLDNAVSVAVSPYTSASTENLSTTEVEDISEASNQSNNIDIVFGSITKDITAIKNGQTKADKLQNKALDDTILKGFVNNRKVKGYRPYHAPRNQGNSQDNRNGNWRAKIGEGAQCPTYGHQVPVGVWNTMAIAPIPPQACNANGSNSYYMDIALKRDDNTRLPILPYFEQMPHFVPLPLHVANQSTLQQRTWQAPYAFSPHPPPQFINMRYNPVYRHRPGSKYKDAHKENYNDYAYNRKNAQVYHATDQLSVGQITSYCFQASSKEPVHAPWYRHNKSKVAKEEEENDADDETLATGTGVWLPTLQENS